MWWTDICKLRATKLRRKGLARAKVGMHFVAIKTNMVYISILALCEKNFSCNAVIYYSLFQFFTCIWFFNLRGIFPVLKSMHKNIFESCWIFSNLTSIILFFKAIRIWLWSMLFHIHATSIKNPQQIVRNEFLKLRKNPVCHTQFQTLLLIKLNRIALNNQVEFLIPYLTYR